MHSNYHAPNHMTSPFLSWNIMKYRPQSPTVVHWFSAPCLHWAHWRGRIPKWHRNDFETWNYWNDIEDWQVIWQIETVFKWARCGTGLRGLQFPVASVAVAHFRHFSIKLRSFQMTSWNDKVKWHRESASDSWTVRWKWIWSWCPASLEHGNSGLKLILRSPRPCCSDFVGKCNDALCWAAEHGSKKIKALHVFPGAQHSLLWGHAEDVRIQAAKQRYMQQWQACFPSFWQLRFSMITWRWVRH